MFCPSCGHKVGEEAAFCHACGAGQPVTGVLAEAAAVAAAAGSLAAQPVANAKPSVDSDRPTLRLEHVQAQPIPNSPTVDQLSQQTRPFLQYAAIGVAVVSVIATIVGGLYAKTLVDQRDATFALAQAKINDLAAANLAFQDQVWDLSATQDQLTVDLGTRATERDSALAERDAARLNGDSLRQQLESTQKHASDLESSLANAQSQLTQARQDSSSQQQRANNADTRRVAVAAVLQLDDQIYSDFYNFLNEVNNMEQALKRYDYFGASTAYSRAQVVSDRLDRLFTQRKAALSKI